METNSKLKDKEYLKNLLSLRLNQEKMLNETLCEVLSNESSYVTVSTIKSEIDSIMDEISEIRAELKNLELKDNVSTNDEQVTYSFYDNIKKPVESKDEKSSTFNIGDFLDELESSENDRIQGNRFLVKFMDSLGIPEIMVKSVYFSNDNGLAIGIYDFIADVNGKKQPIINVLESFKSSFDFSILHLDSYGVVKYTEKYSNCTISHIYRSTLDYSKDDFSEIQICIYFDKVDYEVGK